MENIFVVTIRRLSEFIEYCTNIFASKKVVDQNDADINNYVLNIDYSLIEFDTSEIVH